MSGATVMQETANFSSVEALGHFIEQLSEATERGVEQLTPGDVKSLVHDTMIEFRSTDGLPPFFYNLLKQADGRLRCDPANYGVESLIDIAERAMRKISV